MEIKELHPWQVDPREAIELQKRLSKRVILSGKVGTVRYIAGADVSYSRHKDSGYGVVVVMDYPEFRVIEEVKVKGRIPFPYIPGLLTFREAPILIEAFKRLKVLPDLIMFDGQGITHPRGLGIASHMGIILEIPSIGCAKKRLYGDEEELPERAGSIGLIRKDGRTIGARVRTREGVKPLYVSQGHRISLQEGISFVLDTTRGYKTPEPLRLAHILANRLRLKEEKLEGPFQG